MGGIDYERWSRIVQPPSREGFADSGDFVDLFDETPNGMIHWAPYWSPHKALCNAPLRGKRLPGARVECVVCAELRMRRP